MSASEKTFAWLRFVALSGREGEQWSEAFGHVRPLVRLCAQSVVDLRRGGAPEKSLDMLRCAREGLDTLDAGTDAAVRPAADRFYYGALGYYFYTRRALEEADDSMSRAHHAIVQAVGRHRWLVPMAYDCYELRMHRARIARDRFRWSEMREHAEESAGMRAGRSPLCLLSDGTPIALADVRRFYESLPLTDDDREALWWIVDEDQGSREAARFVRSMFRLSGFVIQYA
ncbi:MAG TPA: hypothetical protein VHG08_23205 [Longimicrobium sp.]|nr:hypothetical protein [Longimicrobium sp.]